VRKLLSVLMLSIVGVLPALAHEGHDHKVMGTVSMIHDNHLEVTDAEGKTVLVNLNEKTKILRGKTAAKAVDIASGEKVVVIYQQVKDKAGKEESIAKEVRLGSPAATQSIAKQ
jgi:hypothetical protein